MKFNRRALILSASIGLYIASLFLDGFLIDRVGNPRAWASCFGLLLIGWIAVFEGVYSWIANPVIFIAWVAYRNSRSTLLVVFLATVSLCLALSFLLYDEILTSEAGHRSRIISHELGYWIWISSIATMVVLPLIDQLLSHTPVLSMRIENNSTGILNAGQNETPEPPTRVV